MKTSRKYFDTCKSVASNLWSNQKVILSPYFFENLREKYAYIKDLEEIRILTNILEKSINEHNSKIQSKKTKLENLRFDDNQKWCKSELFSGINMPFNEIDKKIIENPNIDSYEIYSNFFRK